MPARRSISRGFSLSSGRSVRALGDKDGVLVLRERPSQDNQQERVRQDTAHVLSVSSVQRLDPCRIPSRAEVAGQEESSDAQADRSDLGAAVPGIPRRGRPPIPNDACAQAGRPLLQAVHVCQDVTSRQSHVWQEVSLRPAIGNYTSVSSWKRVRTSRSRLHVWQYCRSYSGNNVIHW